MRQQIDQVQAMISDMFLAQDNQKLALGFLTPREVGSLIDSSYEVQFRHTSCIWADPYKLTRVFQNLIENAEKAMVPIGKIWIRSLDRIHDVQFCVGNENSYLSPDTREIIFNPFVSKTEGTGLGLAIVKKIITDHKGEIWVLSSPIHGTEFCFSIPKKKECS